MLKFGFVISGSYLLSDVKDQSSFVYSIENLSSIIGIFDFHSHFFLTHSCLFRIHYELVCKKNGHTTSFTHARTRTAILPHKTTDNHARKKDNFLNRIIPTCALSLTQLHNASFFLNFCFWSFKSSVLVDTTIYKGPLFNSGNLID